jgi:poly(A) polymerase
MKKSILGAQTLNLLTQTAQYFTEQRQPAYLVGGSLRNILLGEECIDWDIVITGDAHKIARRLADRLGGHYVHMHEKASRVIVIPGAGSSPKKHEICFDVSPQHGKTLEDDLRLRDFTVNAIAAPLTDVVRYLEMANDGPPGATGMDRLHLIDPLHGVADLEARRLKAVDEDAFRRDPLRMLRAVRQMMRYQLQIDPWTENLLRRDAGLLPQVAAERVHDELYAILAPDRATERLRFLDEHGLFTVIFPEFTTARGMPQPRPHYWDVLEHSIETVGALERLAKAVSKDSQYIGLDASYRQTFENLDQIQTLLHEAQQQDIFSFAALTAPPMKLAALMHDIGKPVTYSNDEHGNIHFYNHPYAGVPLVQQAMKRLSTSTQDRRLAQLVAAHHMRPGQLAHVDPVTPRAIRRYFVDLGPAGIYVALVSLADHLATFGPQPLGESWERHLAVVRLLLTRYIRERASILPPQLISPEELMRRLKLEPGPLVGQLLETIAEAQADGTIHSKEEAIWLAEEQVKKANA